jgi:hypothetical protein
MLYIINCIKFNNNLKEYKSKTNEGEIESAERGSHVGSLLWRQLVALSHLRLVPHLPNHFTLTTVRKVPNSIRKGNAVEGNTQPTSTHEKKKTTFRPVII